jgi:carboxyl-terminal processing protease
MDSSKKTRLNILTSIKKRVASNHINVAGIDYDAWCRSFENDTERLLAADVSAFESGVRQHLSALGTSHTVFYHERPVTFPPQHTIGATLRLAAANGQSQWMFLDVFEGGSAHSAGIRPGDLLVALDGVAQATDAAPTFAIGHTHMLTIQSADEHRGGSVTVMVPTRKGTSRRPPIIEPKALSCRLLEPGLGLLRVRYFPGSAGMRFTRELDEAIHGLLGQGTERLIVDLRGNIGGSLGFARLASYFTPDKIAIGYSLTPQKLRAGYRVDSLPRVPMPATRISLVATLAQFAFRDKSVMLLTQGLGPQPFHSRIVLLINEWTTSAGEMVAAFANDNRLAIVVGDGTRGSVLGAMNFEVGGGYWLRLPVFGWFRPDGRSLEGKGVSPNVAVALNDSDLARGVDCQMSRAIEIARSL